MSKRKSNFEDINQLTPKRRRNQTQRFGQRETSVNYDSYFEEHNLSIRTNAPNETAEIKSNSVTESCFVLSQDELDKIIATIATVTSQMRSMNEKVKTLEQKVSTCKCDKSQYRRMISTEIVEDTQSEINFNFPVQNSIDIEQLELRLKNRAFKMLVINWLAKNCSIAHTNQPLTSAVHAIISPKLLAQFTWTGKSSGGAKKKLAFSTLTDVHDTLFVVMLQIKKTYTWSKFLNDMKYSIIKYAYRI